MNRVFPQGVPRLGAAVLSVLLVAACTDSLTAPRGVPAASVPQSSIQAVVCEASVTSGTVRCGPLDPVTGKPRAAIIGGQAVNVLLTSSNVAYTAADSTFSFDVTIQNLLPEKMGTADGVTAHAEGIRVFFASGPSVTGGTGTAAVANADGEGNFTGSGQPYFQYDTILGSSEVSNPRSWVLHVDPAATAFSFVVYVATALQPMLVINELMANPGGTVQDSSGEYVELYNAGRFPVNMRGMMLNDGSGSGIGGIDSITVDFIVPSGGYRVLGRSTNTSRNGGITVDYNYVQVLGGTSTLLQFSNSAADHFRIRAATGVTVDSVGYTNAATAAVAGRARELTNVGLDNTAVDGSSWAQATTNYESANRGTPGALNSTAN